MAGERPVLRGAPVSVKYSILRFVSCGYHTVKHGYLFKEGKLSELN